MMEGGGSDNWSYETCKPMRAPRCKIRPALFPGQMLYKATKPDLVLFYILACFNCIVAYKGPFYVLLILVVMYSVFWLF